MGRKNKFVYCIETNSLGSDPSSFNTLVKYDLDSRSHQFYRVRNNECLGEALFTPKKSLQSEDDGYLIVQGYNSDRDESFLEILDAASLRKVNRLWLGSYLPLGFHGVFVPEK